MKGSDIILVQPLFYKRFVQTNGQDSSSPLILELDIPGVTNLGPGLAGITGHTITDSPESSAFRWNLVYYWGLDGKSWSNAINLFAGIGSSAGQLIHDEVTTRNTFGLHMKYAIALWNNTGTDRINAFISASLVFRFLS